MLSTASYEARKFGVRSGMPGNFLLLQEALNLKDFNRLGFIGKKLCPQLICLPIRGSRYSEMSRYVSLFFMCSLSYLVP